MPSNQTTNYQLSQWVKSDQVRMGDFNADNAKIDTAIKAEADARAAADAALSAGLTLKGNCQMYVGTYIGTGESGQEHPNSYTFPGIPVFYFIFRPGGEYTLFGKGGSAYAQTLNDSGSGSMGTKWNENTVSWVGPSPTGQYNALNSPYTVVAFYQADE